MRVRRGILIECEDVEHDVFYVQPVRCIDGIYCEPLYANKGTYCSGIRSAKAAVTRWKNRTGIRWVLNESYLWKCKVCGCTRALACAGGCSWIKPNLCSKCASK